MLPQILLILSCLTSTLDCNLNYEKDAIEFKGQRIIGAQSSKKVIIEKYDKNFFDHTLTGKTIIQKANFIIILDDVFSDNEFNLCEEPLDDPGIAYVIDTDEDNRDIVFEDLKESEEV